MNISEIKSKIDGINTQELYCTKSGEKYKERFCKLLDGFYDTFGHDDNIRIFSAPGRTEIGGNHTDHQHGAVLAGSLNLDVIGAARLNGTDVIRIKSEGFPMDTVKIDELEPDKSEYSQASGLIRGVAACFVKRGYKIAGFDAYTTSNVLKGSGMSSSAAFEVIVATIINNFFASGTLSAVELAKIGQYAENVYFGKPCGLLDQTACASGGMVSIDFADNENPVVKKIDFDFSSTGYALCIIDTGADHADLTDEYAAITSEMKAVAGFFGKEYLNDVPKTEFLTNIKKVRESLGITLARQKGQKRRQRRLKIKILKDFYVLLMSREGRHLCISRMFMRQKLLLSNR